MKKIKIYKNWPGSFNKQSPKGEGIWNNNVFYDNHEDETSGVYDAVVVLNDVKKNRVVRVRDNNIFLFIMEPPTNTPKWVKNKPVAYKQIITNDENLTGSRIVHNHWPIIWKVNKSYDELASMSAPNKNDEISWVTSNKKQLIGQKKRMIFLKEINDLGIEFDLFGKGFKELKDKWDGIASYKYSLAIENYSGENYWSEKIADCFLSWTLPIYYGCTNIDKYFPKNSYIQIDINDAKKSKSIISEAIKNNYWEKNIKDICLARDLVLNKYQLFPYISNYVKNYSPTGNIKLEEILPEGKKRGLIKKVKNAINFKQHRNNYD